MSIFKLPDLGEGLPDAEIREWHVKVGDEIKTDEPLVSMETAKAVVEVPSPQSGVIKKLYGNSGDVINTGDSLVEFESNNTHNTPANIANSTNSTNNKSDNSSTVAGKIETTDQVTEDNFIIGKNINNKSNNKIKSTPAVRALARQLGVDLSNITPTGHNNLITINDVNNASKFNKSNTEPTEAEKALGKSESLKGVRKAMASAMTEANAEVCAATLFDDADIFNWPDKEDITVRLARAVVTACKAEPGLNAWYNSKNNTIIIPEAIHMGLAVDSEEGLFVPVINNLETMDMSTLRDHINTLKIQIKNRTIPQEQLRGNTITLSNIGTVAGKYASPVVVPPTVSIIAIGKLFNTVKLNNNNQLENHRTIPVSLTFDHRAVTGGEAARFLRAFIADLEL